MNPLGVILIMIATWLIVAVAALWGMLRITHRHQRDAMERARDVARERPPVRRSLDKQPARKPVHA